jgi:hypothetical protein
MHYTLQVGWQQGADDSFSDNFKVSSNVMPWKAPLSLLRLARVLHLYLYDSLGTSNGSHSHRDGFHSCDGGDIMTLYFSQVQVDLSN